VLLQVGVGSGVRHFPKPAPLFSQRPHPRCAATAYSEIQQRQLLQCQRCRYQVSLIPGTILQGTKLPMRVWFRAMHLLAQGKKGLSNIELGRRLGISTNAAWRVQHKLMQAMIERDRRYKLGAAGPRIEIDDAYIGGERTGEGAGRGRRGHTPFIIAVETTSDGRPLYARLQVVRGFQTGETRRLCANVEAGTTIVSDGGQWFRRKQQLHFVHHEHGNSNFAIIDNFGTDFWLLTEILRGMMPKISTRWLARTVKLNGVLPIAALCLICKAEGPILRVGPRRQSRRASRPLRQGEGNSNSG
jgi:hypothetical protein